MIISVIDYGSGNLASASRALALAAEREGLSADIRITSDPAVVMASDRIVLPGQGAFADCAQGLARIQGLQSALFERVADGAPFLGICVGMQLMAERGLEHSVTPGFGWISGEIAEMAPPHPLRLPQMGWNGLSFVPNSHPLLEGLQQDDHVYFVHSNALTGGDPEELLASTDYGGMVPAMVARGNRAGTQFHVEKSQDVGIRILRNFLRWMP
jgi:glutamine amidotransferase